MKKLVIFDLDGTLLDTIEDLGNATNHALRSLGFPERTREEYYRLVGRGITNLFKGAVPEGCDTPEIIDRMRELREAGKTYAEIGDIMGRTPAAVFNVLKRADRGKRND
jgi:phosphoglycolate phosphatase